MRILPTQEEIKRGCDYCAHVNDYCAHVNDTVKKVCPYDECPYHELDEFDTYSEYLKRLLSKGNPPRQYEYCINGGGNG